MITTRTAPRTRRLLIAGFVLSVMVHLFGGALWAHVTQVIARVMHRLPQQHEREQEVETSDVVHLERRAVPRPAVARRAQPAPHPVSKPQPRPRPQKRVAVLPKPEVQPSMNAVARPAPSAVPEIAHRAVHAPPHIPHPQRATQPGAGAPQAAAGHKALSAAQIAQLNAQFAKTISSSHVDLATIQKRTEEQPVATKRYPMQFAGLQATLERGEGYIEPITAGQRIGSTVWYYTHYTYMWPDGHLEDDDIPWPFRYPVQHDLFALHIHLIPLQLPPPGYHLTRPLKPFLAHFLQTAGRG